MGRHCSWRTGGVAERFFEPEDAADLSLFLQHAPSTEQITWLGLGSNLLVRDGGLDGTVVATTRALSGIRALDQHRIYVESGVPCAKLAKIAAKQDLGGGEFLAGIPGTVGGALAMNAGAFGGETWDLVESVRTIDHDGVIRERARQEFSTAYRAVVGPRDEWYLGATMQFVPGQAREAAAKIKSLLGQRSAAQPVGQASCGSVFRNPCGDHAGRLIEAAGLKGMRIGGCFVSEKHANFIINDGSARADDIEALIKHVQHTVREKFGVTLEPEVRIIGKSGTDRDSRHAQ